MQRILRHKFLIAGVAAVLAASAGGAYAATQSGTNPRQAFLNDVAKRLNVSPAQLNSAVKGALIDRLNAAVKDGQLTQAQANKLKQRINRGGTALPFFFPGPARAFGPGGLPGPGGLLRGLPGPYHLRIQVRGAGGGLHAAATYLGLKPAQLMADLASGKSLAQVAKAQGKSVSGLEQELINKATKRLSKLESKGAITKAQEQKILSMLSSGIDKLVNSTGFGPPPMGKVPRMMVPGGPPPSGSMQKGGPMMPPAAYAPASPPPPAA